MVCRSSFEGGIGEGTLTVDWLYSDAFARTRARGSRVTRVTCRASAILMVYCRCLQKGGAWAATPAAHAALSAADIFASRVAIEPPSVSVTATLSE